MKKNIFILLMVVGSSLFSQNYNKAFHIMLQSIDTTYFEENGLRWSDFSLTPKKYYKVMDLIESDTTCGCMVFKDNKPYIKYIKEVGMYDKRDRKLYKKIIGYLECKYSDYEVFMWVDHTQAFGSIITHW